MTLDRLGAMICVALVGPCSEALIWTREVAALGEWELLRLASGGQVEHLDLTCLDLVMD